MMEKRRRVLIVASRFPDAIHPAGSLRVEGLVRCLREFGWEPVVLSVRMPQEALVAPVHRSPRVFRTPSHYGSFARAYRGRFTESGNSLRRGGIELGRRLKNLVLVPDDFVLWWPRAIVAAVRIARRLRPTALLVTAPPFSQLPLGVVLSRLLGLPLLSDFRDDWVGNPALGARSITQALTDGPFERRVVRRSSRIVCVTPRMAENYRARYPGAAERVVWIPNGYDEKLLSSLAPRPKPPGRLELLHIGSLKANRSPEPVFRAMERLRARDGRYGAIRFRLVGMTYASHRSTAADLGGQVEWRDTVPQREIAGLLEEADATVLLAHGDNPVAVPTKIYEYLRAARPMLVVSEPNGATEFLQGFSGVSIRSPEDVDGIAADLGAWFDATDPPATVPEEARPYSRRAIAGQVAAELDAVARCRTR